MFEKVKNFVVAHKTVIFEKSAMVAGAAVGMIIVSLVLSRNADILDDGQDDTPIIEAVE